MWKWEKKQLEELQDLYCTREARKLYSKVKETKKEFKPRVNICEAKDGSIICDQNEVLTRWNEHFDDLLNKNNQEHIAAEGENIQLIEGPAAEETDTPTFEELEEAINTFTAIVDLSRFNNSCLKSPASTLVDLTFQLRALRSFSLNQIRNLSL